MSSEHRHDALVKALEAISGVNAVPHCLLPMLAGQTLCVPVGSEKRSGDEARELFVYTDACTDPLKKQAGGYQDMTMPQILALMDRDGLDGFVIDPGLPRRLSVRGTALAALRSRVGDPRGLGASSEEIDFESGSELAITAPDPAPSDGFLRLLKAVLHSGGPFKRAWLFETILPENSVGELCVGVEPVPESDLAAIERSLGDVAQKHADLLAGRSSLAFLPLQDSELIDLVQSVGVFLADGAGR